MIDAEFQKLLDTCVRVQNQAETGVFIGGIAVYIHAVNGGDETSCIAAATHDGDMVVSIMDMQDLREEEELTSNRRLRKHELKKNGFSFDIYTERQNGLRVPYDEISARSVSIGGLRLASLEDLLILKAVAMLDRTGTVKGDKDAKDIIRIVSVMSNKEIRPDWERIKSFLDEDAINAIVEVGSSPAFFTSLYGGNSFLAKKSRDAFNDVIADHNRMPAAHRPTPY